MTNREKLIRDLQLIADNHGMNAAIEDFEKGKDNPCIYGGYNVPMLSDLQQLCESVQLPTDCLDADEFGVTVEIPSYWYLNTSTEPWEPMYELWLKCDQTTVTL